jgi:hypothetical protein
MLRMAHGREHAPANNRAHAGNVTFGMVNGLLRLTARQESFAERMVGKA